MLNRRIYDFFNSLPVSGAGQEKTEENTAVSRYVPWLFAVLAAVAAFLWVLGSFGAPPDTDEKE